MYVDLHVHSVYSDGTLTPVQLVRQALEARVSLIALADHNTLAGCVPMREACAAAGIGCIDAVEIDTLFHGEDLHILAYGFERREGVFEELVRHSRAMLDRMSDDLVLALQKDGKDVSLAEYVQWPAQTGKGGWKALYYLREKLHLPQAKDVFGLYDRYSVTYADAGFAGAQETIRAIHAAGGYAVLAHPGDVSRMEGRVCAAEIAEQMKELFALGLDGAECWYPKHTQQEAFLFESTCLQNGKMVTSGSDCHGSFSGKPVGFMQKSAQELRLDALSERIYR